MANLAYVDFIRKTVNRQTWFNTFQEALQFRWFSFFTLNCFCFSFFLCFLVLICFFFKFEECVSQTLCSKKVGKSAYEKCIENATHTHCEQPNFICQASVKFKVFAQNFLIKHFQMLCVNGENVQCSWMRASFSTNQNRNSHTHARKVNTKNATLPHTYTKDCDISPHAKLSMVKSLYCTTNSKWVLPLPYVHAHCTHTGKHSFSRN